MARRYSRKRLTPEEWARFGWLSKGLTSVSPDERPDLDTLLERQKAKGVSLDDLANALLMKSAGSQTYKSPRRRRPVSRNVHVREELARFIEDVRLLREAMVRVEEHGVRLDAPRLGVRPPIFSKLFSGLHCALTEAANTANCLRDLLKQRVGKTRPPREGVSPPLNVSGPDWRELSRAARLAAPHVFVGSWSIKYGTQPPCPSCGNPAPLLFSREE